MSAGNIGNEVFEFELMDPIKDIHKFEGKVWDRKQNKANDIDIDCFIPRGATIQNSLIVYALVVYTGKETKLVQNEGKYSFKISDLSKKVNYYIGMNILTMIVLILLYS